MDALSKLSVFIAMAMVATIQLAAASQEGQTVAEFRGGRITLEQLLSWRQYRNGEALLTSEAAAAPASTDELTQIAVQLEMSRRAHANDLDRSADFRMAVWWQSVSRLERELRRHLANDVQVAPEDLAEAVDKVGDRLDRPKRVRLYNLLIAASEQMKPADRAERREHAERLRQLVSGGRPIGPLAAAHSASQTRWRDGLIGWTKAADLRPEFQDKVMNLEPGEVSNLISTPTGYLFFYCADVKQATDASEDEVRDAALKRIRRKAMNEELEQLRASALADVSISVGELDLETEISARSDKWTLGGEEVAALFKIMSIEEGVASRQARLAGLEEIAYRRWAALEAQSIGLDKAAPTAAYLEWVERSIRVANETRRVVMEAFVTPERRAIVEYFETHRDRFTTPAAIRLGVIRRTSERAQGYPDLALLEEVRQQIEIGELSFSAAAREHSELPSASNDGTPGWLTRQQVAALGPRISSAIQTISDGELSPVIEQAEGLHGTRSYWLVKRFESRPPRPSTLSEVEDQVENILANEQIAKLQVDLLQRVVAQLDLRPVAGTND